MRLKLEDPRVLAHLIGIISELVTEVRIKVTKDGMSLTALDPANVAMVYFNIPNDLFAEFNVDKDEVLGVNLDNLNAIMRRCKLGSSLIAKTESLKNNSRYSSKNSSAFSYEARSPFMILSTCHPFCLFLS